MWVLYSFPVVHLQHLVRGLPVRELTLVNEVDLPPPNDAALGDDTRFPQASRGRADPRLVWHGCQGVASRVDGDTDEPADTVIVREVVVHVPELVVIKSLGSTKSGKRRDVRETHQISTERRDDGTVAAERCNDEGLSEFGCQGSSRPDAPRARSSRSVEVRKRARERSGRETFARVRRTGLRAGGSWRVGLKFEKQVGCDGR